MEDATGGGATCQLWPFPPWETYTQSHHPCSTDTRAWSRSVMTRGVAYAVGRCGICEISTPFPAQIPDWAD